MHYVRHSAEPSLCCIIPKISIVKTKQRKATLPRGDADRTNTYLELILNGTEINTLRKKTHGIHS